VNIGRYRRVTRFRGRTSIIANEISVPPRSPEVWAASRIWRLVSASKYRALHLQFAFVYLAGRKMQVASAESKETQDSYAKPSL
jgi:hypothetical protein